MPYVLSVDLGTTFTAAAVCPVSGGSLPPTMLSLGSASYSVPSALFLREDGTFLAGESAELRSSADPTRVARYFKRRLGDEVPVRLAGTPFAPQVLVTRLLEWVIAQAAERQGRAPHTVVLTHPANWGPYRRELLQQAAVMAGVSEPLLIAEPEAAAVHYVQSERIDPGELLAVYDLGGGTFDAVVMQRTETGFETLGHPAGVDRLGGMDFDDVIRSFVLDAAELDDIDQADEASVTSAYALQASCIDAKRVLSADTVADVRVVFPGVSTSVRVNRSEFEDRIRPRLVETLSALQAAIDSAGITADDLSRILLVGGSSRIPLVSALLAQRFGRPLAVDSDPKNTVALGAARYGAAVHAPAPAPPISPLEAPAPHVPAPTPEAIPPPVEPPAVAPPTVGAPAEPTGATPAPPQAPKRPGASSAAHTSASPPSAATGIGAGVGGSDGPVSAPSTQSATARQPAEAASPTSEEPAGELFSVQAESGHRTRLPQPSDRAPQPPEAVSAQAEAVGLDPKLLAVAAVVAVVLLGIAAFVLLTS